MTYQLIGESGRTVGGLHVTMAEFVPTAVAIVEMGGFGSDEPGEKEINRSEGPLLAFALVAKIVNS
jgi:hypothetical protein